jgi:4a-hydroxytetrahydrobiopterin dehydratase
MAQHKVQKLEAEARAAALKGLPLWQDVPGRDAITRQFTFSDFNAAFGFMTKSALMAEKLDHHPEWSNVYNRVTVVLTTHDCAGVSERDIKMARFMDRAAGELA